VLNHILYSVKNNRYIFPLLIFFTSTIVYSLFLLEGFGEPDSARIGVSIINILENGISSPLSTYYFSDNIPLYMAYLKFLLNILSFNYSNLPQLMNITNVLFSILNLQIIYLFTYKLFNNRIMSFSIVILFIFTPGNFISSIYGFPHIIANTFFLLSLYLFLHLLENNRLKNYILPVYLLSMIFAISSKSDIIIAFGAFYGILYYTDKLNLKNILWTTLSIIISLLIFYFIRHKLFPNIEGSTTSTINFVNWFAEFKPELKDINTLLQKQIKPIVFTFGVITTLITIVFLVFGIIKKHWKPIILLILWSAPIITFWLIIAGNSARHNFSAILPILIFTILSLHYNFKNKILILVFLIILGNAIITPISTSTGSPSARLFKSARLINTSRNNNHKLGQLISNIHHPNIIIFGSYKNPWIVYEIIKLSESYCVKTIEGRENFELNVVKNNETFTYKFFYDYKNSDVMNIDWPVITLIENYELLCNLGYTVISMNTDCHQNIIIK